MFRKIFSFISFMMVTILGSAAQAGGVEPPQPIYSGIYLEGDIGYAGVNWHNYAFAPPNFGSFGSSGTINTFGGFTFGSDLGYQFNQFIALEVGWFYIPTVRGTFDDITMTAKGGVAYGDGKLSVPVYSDTLYLFAKAGAAYRYTRLTSNSPVFFNGTLIPINGNYWSAIFGAGVQYYFYGQGSVHMEYLRVGGYETIITPPTINRLNVPQANVLLVGIGYKFVF